MESAFEVLAALRNRFARGEIDEATFERLSRKLLESLTGAEREELGLGGAPSPASPGASGPLPPSGRRLPGPSGGPGQAIPTRVASRAATEVELGNVLFGKWRVKRALGRGGIGVTYEVDEVRLGRRLAAKVLDRSLAADEERLDRFRRGVAAMRRLDHPGIVRVFDYDEDASEGLALVAMELVEGCTVESLVATARRRGEAVPVPLAVGILARVLDALDHAHAHGERHGDVKPANVLLAGGAAEELLSVPSIEPQVKLADFGLAAALEQGARNRRGAALRGVAYAPPEALAPGAEPTPEADVYGAGAVFYELLTGQVPLGRFEHPSALRPATGEELDSFVLGLLQRQAARRPRAGAARAALLEIAAGASRSVPPGNERGDGPEEGSGEEAANGAESHETPGPEREAEVESVAEAREAAAVALPSWTSRTEPGPARRQALGLKIALGTGLLVAASVVGWLSLPSSKKEAAPAEAPAVVEEAASEATGSAATAPGPVGPPAVVELAVPSPAASGSTSSLRWMTIPAGSFTMGCVGGDDSCDADETPAHRVTLTTRFLMAATETTNAQYRPCVEAGACAPPAERTAFDDPSKNDHPVVNVAWKDAAAFCRWSGGRLPTEAEWEYGARGGREGLLYPWGNQIIANEAQESGDGTVPVGQFAPNGFGLHDMSGNVWEWCEDWYGADYYASSPSEDPRGPADGDGRVVRGGFWRSTWRTLRVSLRDWFDPDAWDEGYGFRCVRDAQMSEPDPADSVP